MEELPPLTQYTPKQAVQLQKELSGQLVFWPLPASEVKTIGGADISYNRFSDIIYAGIVVLSFPDMQLIEECWIKTTATFPYIPGLLSFRELPALLSVWEALQHKPDVMALDGQGIAHPRRLGIAAHFGLVTGCPAFGCAKSVLVGDFEEPDFQKGSIAYMYHQNEPVGAALRTQTGVKPVYISAGYKITLPDALAIIQQCTTRYRIPEPTRQAHLLVNRIRTCYKLTPT